MTFELFCAKSEEKLKDFPDNYFDSVVADGPYGIRFMGKAWDSFDIKIKSTERNSYQLGRVRAASGRKADGFGSSIEAGKYDPSANQQFQQWTTMMSLEVLRVLKPGGYFLSFSSPRTFHRLVSGIEDAGFEIRDTLMWVFASGFPKSHNLSIDIKKFIVGKGEKCSCLDGQPDQYAWQVSRYGNSNEIRGHRQSYSEKEKEIRDSIISINAKAGSNSMRLLFEIYYEKTQYFEKEQEFILFQELRKCFSKEKGFGCFEIWRRVEEDKEECSAEGQNLSDLFSIIDNQRIGGTPQDSFQIWWHQFIEKFNSALQELSPHNINISTCRIQYIIDHQDLFGIYKKP